METNENEFIVVDERRVKRFDLKNAFSSILESLNLERGILFTLWSLLRSPGKSTKDFLQAGRLRYISPFRLLIVSTTLLVLIFSITDFSNELLLGVKDGMGESKSIGQAQFEKGYSLGADLGSEGLDSERVKKIEAKSQQINDVLTKYFNLVIWAYIPIVAFFTWLFNRKKELNYAEHLVFNAFYTSVINIFTLIFFLGMLINIGYVYAIYLLGSLFYFVYYYKDLLRKTWLRSIWEASLITLLSFLVYTLTISVIMVFALR